jgi:hypothetical protein
LSVTVAEVTAPNVVTTYLANQALPTPLTAGTRITVSAALPQSRNGRLYTFQKWSDSQGADHDLTLGASPTTLTATFVPNPSATAVTVATSPDGMTFSVNG